MMALTKAPKHGSRYVVNGVNVGRCMLVQLSTDDPILAAQLHDWLTGSDWSANVYDTTEKRFVQSRVLELLAFYAN